MIAIVESIRDILEEKEILTGELYRAIMSQSESQTQEGVSSASVEKSKAANFISKRVSVLLTHLVENTNSKNVKEMIRVLMPFVQGAIESLDETESVAWLMESCTVLENLFEAIV